MSSVSGSDSSSSNPPDPARKAREANQSNEADVAKKHQREIRKLTEQHYAEIESLKKSHSDQLDQIRQHSHDEINERDHKYQQEMEDMRGLYRKQLQGQADDAQRREDVSHGAVAGDEAKEKEIHENRVKTLSESYENNIRAQQKMSEENSQEAREAQKAAIGKNRDAVVGQYETEGKMLAEENDNKLTDLQKTYDSYRHNTMSRLQDQEQRHLHDQQRSSNAAMSNVQKERRMASDEQIRMREGYTSEIDKTREKFNQAIGQQRESADTAREQMNTKFTNQIENQVNTLERDNRDMKESMNTGSTLARQRSQRELANVTEAYQKNMDNYKDQRDMAVRGSNDRVHKAAESVRQDLSKQMTDTSRNFKIMEDEQNQIHRLAYKNIKGDFDSRNEMVSSNAEARVKNLIDKTNEDREHIVQNQDQLISVSQQAHQDQMRALRANMEDDKQTTVGSLLQRLQKQEVQHTEKMNQVVGKYEKQVQELQDRLLKEKKASDENLKRSAEEMMRAHKLSMDQEESQSRDRLRQVDERRLAEINALNKRSEEKMNQVLAEAKKT